MPVINGLRDGVGVGFPTSRDNVVTAPEMLECERCGVQRPANEWSQVAFEAFGLDPRRCSFCFSEGFSVRPRPILREPEPWTPKVGDRVRVKGRRAEVVVRELWRCKSSAGEPVPMVRADGDFHKDMNFQVANLEPCEPADPRVVAVVVRGLGCGETARVVLCRSEEEAAREQRDHGGVVVGGDQVVWA